MRRSCLRMQRRYLAYFGNRAFYRPRLDLLGFPFWTSFYELDPIRETWRAT